MNALRRCAVVATILGTLTSVGRASAQRGNDRVAVFRLRDSLAHVSDSIALTALEVQTLDSARKNRDEPLVKFRLGFIDLRLAELTGSPGRYRDAESEFQWITELQPQWPLGWYALGVAELSEADNYSPMMRSMMLALGRDIFIAPAHDLARSAIVDSTFTLGVVQLADEALLHHISSHLTTALLALRAVGAASASHDRAVLLARGQIERETGNVDSALAAFDAMVLRNRFDARALLESARTQLAAGRVSGVDPWYLGLALADSSTLSMYRADLSLVMSDSALQVFDTARGQARVSVAHRFWDTRDPDQLNTSGERLREHYRRLDVAHREFPLLAAHKRYDSVRTFEATQSLFDDRGRIYVRQGDPDEKTSLNLATLPPNETWLYRRAGGDLIFNFAQPDSAQGYRLYESILDIVGLGTAAQNTGQGNVRSRLEGGAALQTYGAGWTAQAAEELLYSRQKMSPLFAKMLSAGPKEAQQLQVAERDAGRRSMQIGLQTDAWKFRYELPMAADVDVFAIGSDSLGEQLQVAFAIPGSSLYAPPTTGTVTYPIRARVNVRDKAGNR